MSLIKSLHQGAEAGNMCQPQAFHFAQDFQWPFTLVCKVKMHSNFLVLGGRDSCSPYPCTLRGWRQWWCPGTSRSRWAPPRPKADGAGGSHPSSCWPRWTQSTVCGTLCWKRETVQSRAGKITKHVYFILRGRKSTGVINTTNVSVPFKGVGYDSGESLLIFELNSQTNTPLPLVLLQTRARAVYEHRTES